MGLPKSKPRTRLNSSPFDEHREKVAELFDALDARREALTPHEQQQVSKAIDQLSSGLGSLVPLEDAEPFTPRAPLRIVEEFPSSPSQPVQEILDCIPDSHIVTSPKGMIHLANQQAVRLFNLSQSQLTGLSLSKLIPATHWADLLDRLRTLEGEVENWQGEIHILPYAQPTRSVVCTLSALRDTNDHLVGAHWLLWDMTEHRQGIMAQEFSHEIGQLLLAGMTVEQTLSMICRRLVETFNYPFVWVGTKEAGGMVRVLAQCGEHVLAQGRGLGPWEASDDIPTSTIRAIQQNATQVLRIDQCEDPSRGEWLRTQGFQSEVVIPLALEGRVLGVLAVCSHDNDAFDGTIVRWLEQLCVQISKALLVSKDYGHLRLQEKALNVADHAVCITNPRGEIEWVNDAFCRLSGYDVREVIGTVLPSSQTKQFRLMLEQAQRCDPGGQPWRVEAIERRKDGCVYTVEETLTPLLGEDGHVSNVVAILQDITDRKEAEAQIIHRVHHDPLTDLPNRVMFHDRLEQALAQTRRHRRLLAVMFIDLDCFKQINDSFGHRVGDQLLKTVAQRLTLCVRATDTVARLSGDEFTLILQDLDRVSDAQHVAQKVLDCIGEPVHIDGVDRHVRTSIGIALFPFHASEPESLLQRADRAMYRAKERGGQCWAFAADNGDPDVSEPTALSQDSGQS